MTAFEAPSPPYVGPAAHHGAANNKPINHVTIHSTVGPTKAGSARNVARMFRITTRDASAHYVVDASETLQVVYDSVVAYHAPPNTHSLGIEMCDYPDPGSLKRWSDAEHQAMLERVAQLTAGLCLAYDVPPWYRNAAALKRGEHGITTHRQVSLAWHQTTHWDPGMWPRLQFMRRVRAIIAERQTPPTPQQEQVRTS